MNDEIKTHYQVSYKPTGTKLAEADEAVKPGVHGLFNTRTEADVAKGKCLAWFNTRKIIETVRNGDNVEVIVSEKTVNKNVVQAFIEEVDVTYNADGKAIKREKRACSASSDTESEQDTSSTKSKSPKSSSRQLAPTSQLETAEA